MVVGIELKLKGITSIFIYIDKFNQFRFRRRIIMKLDDNHRYQTILPSKQTEFYPNPSYIYIGGFHRLCTYNEQHCQSYRGCLKNVTIDNNYINLINDEINQYRILKQCHDFY